MAVNYYQVDEGFIQPLTPAVTLQGNRPPSSLGITGAIRRGCCKWHSVIWLKSKAAVLIMLWNLVVGFTLATVLLVALASPIRNFRNAPFFHLVYLFLGVYGAIGLLQMCCYPLGGLLADLRCGRYRTVLCSMVNLWFGYICISLMSIVYTIPHQPKGGLLIAIGSIAIIFAVSGFTGFQANAVQFGLDQLQDMCSAELSVFLHWFVWMDCVGTLLAHMLGAAWLCDAKFAEVFSFKYAPHAVVLLVTGLALITYYKRGWFHSEPRTHNPYGTVYRVLKFAAKHNRPLRRSAFAYCDDERPSRIEFAKQRFGGPFTTETVEDVRTFLRILIMLVAIGPIYLLNVSAMYVFPLFGMHIGPNQAVDPSNKCDVHWLLLQSNNTSQITSVVLLPLYIMFVHPHVPRWLPRILHRLGVGVALLVLSVAAMLVVEGTGHMYAHAHNLTNITCMFLAEYRNDSHHQHIFSQTLEMNTLVLLVPSLLTGIAVPLIYITILEFISAQGPHTMKGLLLGVFYAIRGLFIVLGVVFTMPYVQQRMWRECKGAFTCGFYYYLMNTVLGVLSLVLFCIAAKWYRYRTRDDRPYGPMYVEDYYSRYAQRNSPNAVSPEQDISTAHTLLGYGTFGSRARIRTKEGAKVQGSPAEESGTSVESAPLEEAVSTELAAVPSLPQPGEPLPPQQPHIAGRVKTK